jgi:hypothetical protein
MTTALKVIGTLLMLMGAIWYLQGANVLTVGNSPMIGDSRWEYYGAVAVVVGLTLFVVARRRKS